MTYSNSDLLQENYLTRQCYQIYEEVYDDIKDEDSGILYKVIKKIVNTKENHNEILETICNNCNIRENADLEDDIDSLGDIVVLFLSKPDRKTRHSFINTIKTQVNVVRKSVVSRIEDKDMKLYQVVVGACILVGFYFVAEYTNSTKNRASSNRNKKTKETGRTSTSYQKQDEQSINIHERQSKLEQKVALCLVVPAFIVAELRENDLINGSEIEKLIDNASYFLCKTVVDADSVQQPLQPINENLAHIGERTPAYIKIYIDRGQEMIDKKVPYSLKSNLPLNCQGTVEQLVYLRNLSGLEAFNRV
ncbi:hypothetical protein [Nostoc sp. FACHB-280]|uniref:hypothetical protein n=1 Tax=Nostoc sp. FACHB-280 TaxID=2692839 RepID=UPI00168A8BDB|nr:hypothetical protein [Nostoc sp. FACHB-280]MBD2497986.1 hypothetical protein [Nostoc sp. FACHB-280]